MTTALPQILQDAIAAAVTRCGWEAQPAEITLDIPQESKFGDFSTNIAMRLCRKYKLPPAQIAKTLIPAIQQELDARDAAGLVSQTKLEGAGFINFYCSDAYFCRELARLLRDGEEYFRATAGKGTRALIEFVSANPTGPLSVAHARQAAVGDALANVLAFQGYEVQREYYLNDEGNQINILGRSVELRMRELKGETVAFPEDHYQGDYIYDIAREVTAHKDAVKDCATFAADYILAIIRKELDDFGVQFDCWYSQKELGKGPKIKEALELLRQKGYIYDSEGAVWFKSTAFGDDKDRVVIKSDGSMTYLTPDIAYHQDKYARGFDMLVNLWGPDHHGYIARLKASVAAFGKDPATLNVVIVQLATIFRDGQPVQMSTRRGQYITLREVLDEVGKDAARFFFLMRRTSSHLDFDLGVAKKQTSENPVFYVQYAHARICSILAGAPKLVPAGVLELGLLTEPEERALIRALFEFSSILHICVSTLDPYMLTVYLMGLAEHFHKFYDKHRVLGQEEPLTRARLALLLATKTVIAKGLALMGVSQPEKM